MISDLIRPLSVVSCNRRVGRVFETHQPLQSRGGSRRLDPPYSQLTKRPVRSLPPSKPLTGPAPPRRSVCAPGTMSFHCIADRVYSTRSFVMRSRIKTCLHLEALEDRCLLSFDPALLGSVGLVAESAAVSDFNNGSNHDLATANSVSLAAGQSTQDCHLVGSWAPAASMAEPRAFYSATLLDDGRVLVAGGFVRTNGIGPPLGGHYSAGVEIYDPTSDTWSPTAHLLTGRAGHGAVRLEDGRVLVAG